MIMLLRKLIQLSMLTLVLSGCTNLPTLLSQPHVENTSEIITDASDNQGSVLGKSATVEEQEQNSEVDAVRIEPVKTSSVTAKELNEGVGLVPGPFRVQVGDRLRVLIWGHPDLGHVSDVYSNGSITLPLVGEVFVSNRTLSEVKELITGRLKQYETYDSSRLREGDQIRIGIWGYPELTTDLLIQSNGVVYAPLVGEVKVLGREIKEINQEITEKLSELIVDPVVTVQPIKGVGRQLVVDPVVSVLPESVRERRVSVIGQVAAPGLYPIRDSLTVIEALTSANFLRSGALNSVIVIRGYNTPNPEYKRLRIKDFISGKATTNQNLYLVDQDVVIVPKRFITKVDHFVQDFLVSVTPIFTFWSAGYAALAAKDSREILRDINNANSAAGLNTSIDLGLLNTQSTANSLLDASLDSLTNSQP